MVSLQRKMLTRDPHRGWLDGTNYAGDRGKSSFAPARMHIRTHTHMYMYIICIHMPVAKLV